MQVVPGSHSCARGQAAAAQRLATTVLVSRPGTAQAEQLTVLRGHVRSKHSVPAVRAYWVHRGRQPLWPLSAAQAAAVSTSAPAKEGQQAATAASQQPPPATTFVLDVGGMKCGGCSAAVKRMLSQQDYVLSAGVNLVTNSAAVGVPAGPNAAALAEQAAATLTSKGFPSRVRQPDDEAVLGGADADKGGAGDELSLANLAFAWGLVAFCCLHHAGHLLHDLGVHSVAHLPLLHAMGNPWVSGLLGAAALLGPGRPLIADGAVALFRGAPNMNSLIGLGAATSFAIGAASSAVPGLTWDPSFVEEPVMLLAFVLLGRTLEARARARASSDLRSLASLIPAEARLILDLGVAPGAKAPSDGAAAVDTAMVLTKTVRAGDIVRVLPGERFPVDGKVIEGRCGADESMLTGESLPVAKAPGDAVCAGTVCYEGAVAIKATSTGQDSRLAGIGRLVADAQAREAPVQRLADAVAGKFCYSVMTASAATFVFWSTLGTRLFPQALDSVPALEDAVAGMAAGSGAAALLLATKLAVDVLVVACPCALGLATPTAVVVASSVGARRGLLIRGGDVIESLAKVDTVVLDKTGTLTQGRLQLQGVRAFSHAALASTSATNPELAMATGAASSSGSTNVGDVFTVASVPSAATSSADAQLSPDDEVLSLAAAVEAQTRHPVADAVLAACQHRGLQVPAADACTTVPGEGVTGVVGGRLVAVGKLAWVRQQVGDLDTLSATDSSPGYCGSGSNSGSGRSNVAGYIATGEEAAAPQTTVYVGRAGDGLLGSASFADALRPEAVEAVRQLRERGMQVHVMSGDHPGAVNAAALSAGIDRASVQGDMRPEDKVAGIRALRAQGKIVAMVGDGVNDAPALAGADVGVAVHSGMEAAGEAADVVLLGDNLGQVVQAVDLGRATLSKIRANLTWALFYNLAGIPLAAGVLLPTYGVALSPSVAGGLMAFSSVAVVSNSLLLRAQLGGSEQQRAPQQP